MSTTVLNTLHACTLNHHKNPLLAMHRQMHQLPATMIKLHNKRPHISVAVNNSYLFFLLKGLQGGQSCAGLSCAQPTLAADCRSGSDLLHTVHGQAEAGVGGHLMAEMRAHSQPLPASRWLIAHWPRQSAQAGPGTRGGVVITAHH